MEKTMMTPRISRLLGVSILAATVLLLMVAWQIPPRESLRRQVAAVKTTKPPVIDGRLNEPAWQKSPVFAFVHTIGVPGTPRQHTEGRVLYDDQRLYVSIKCQETEIELLKKTQTERDSAVWSDDYVEIFIDSDLDRKTFHQIIVNPLGTIFDQNSAGGEGKKWNGDIKVSTHVGPDYWTIEMSIGLASIDLANGIHDIGFNMNRYRVTKPSGGYQDTCWSPLRSWKSATPEMFGVLKGLKIK
jgi:hypothetical protein